MGKADQEPTVTFTEISRPAKASFQQHSSPAFDGRFMIYCQGIKLFIPEDFRTEALLKLLRVMKQL